ncbi:MAG: ketopantoate reductase family protein, partial [Thermoplasmata archaeon]
MKILVVGAGAVGSLLGARLAAAGEAVELIGRPEHVRAMRAHGLRVEGTGAGTF